MNEHFYLSEEMQKEMLKFNKITESRMFAFMLSHFDPENPTQLTFKVHLSDYFRLLKRRPSGNEYKQVKDALNVINGTGMIQATYVDREAIVNFEISKKCVPSPLKLKLDRLLQDAEC